MSRRAIAGPASVAAAAVLALASCGRADVVRDADAGTTRPGTLAAAAARSDTTASTARLAYSGHDARGIPHYAHVALDSADRSLLRVAFGIENPGHLYVSDSTRDGVLKYDTRAKPCRICYVNSYDVGFVSVRRPGESWEEVERRVRHTAPSAFSDSRRTYSTSVDALDPAIQGEVRQMLADARRAGFSLRLSTTYRSPVQEAYLMAKGGKRTHTLTSMHSYGRALDVLVGDGVPGHQRTRRQWIAFRRWVTAYHGGEFDILGSPERTWDWPHIEVPTPTLGFRSIDAAIAAARSCVARGGPQRTPAACEFLPHLPASH